MAARYLGQPFDIHTASTDLCFPHGDNEIAIAGGLNNKPLAKVWMHSEVVMAEGKKVSRAAGNDLTLEHLAAEGFDGSTVRYWLLATHYRTVLHFAPAELQRAGRCVSRLNEFVARLGVCQGKNDGVGCHTHACRGHVTCPETIEHAHDKRGHGTEVDQALETARTNWQDALDHDLNVPKALGKLFAFVRHVNRLIGGGELGADQARQVLDFMRQVNGVLDVMDFQCPTPDTEVAHLIEVRWRARQAKDYALADTLREKLESLGVRLADSPAGTAWTKVRQ
jgi:cysteinyl-tRNA synthetase